MRMAIAPNLPYDIILGRDWPYFANLVSMGLSGEEARECGGREGPDIPLGEEQRRDQTLRAAWERAERGVSTTDSGAKLVLRQGVLYRVGKDSRTQDEVEQLVLPASCRRSTLEMAHDSPWGGTWERGRPQPGSWLGHIGPEYTGTSRNTAPRAPPASLPNLRGEQGGRFKPCL